MKGRFKPLAPPENFQPWVFPIDEDVKSAIALFDEIKAKSVNTPTEAREARKLIRQLNRLLDKLGFR